MRWDKLAEKLGVLQKVYSHIMIILSYPMRMWYHNVDKFHYDCKEPLPCNLNQCSFHTGSIFQQVFRTGLPLTDQAAKIENNNEDWTSAVDESLRPYTISLRGSLVTGSLPVDSMALFVFSHSSCCSWRSLWMISLCRISLLTHLRWKVSARH